MSKLYNNSSVLLGINTISEADLIFIVVTIKIEHRTITGVLRIIRHITDIFQIFIKTKTIKPILFGLHTF